MSTKATILVMDDTHQNCANIYVHWDGYWQGVGRKLADMLIGKHIVHGIQVGQTGEFYANGYNNLAAQITWALMQDTKDQIGNVYLQPTVNIPYCDMLDPEQAYVFQHPAITADWIYIIGPTPQHILDEFKWQFKPEEMQISVVVYGGGKHFIGFPFQLPEFWE